MRVRTMLSLLVTHVVLSVASFLWNYQLSSSSFDGKDVSHWSLQVARMLHEAFWFPIAKPLLQAIDLPRHLGWAPVILNSALVVLSADLLLKGARALIQKRT